MTKAVIPVQDGLGISYNLPVIHPEGVFIASSLEMQDTHPESTVLVPNHSDPFLRPVVEGTDHFDIRCIGPVQK